MEIDFLSEAPRGHGFAFTGVVSVLIASLMYAIIGKIRTEILLDRELPMEEKYLFDEIYQLSLELLTCISKEKSVGSASNYTLLLTGNSLPTVHFSEKTPHSPIEDVTRKDTLLGFLGIDNQTIQKLPLDYGVIFTGMEYTFSDIEAIREQTKKEHDRLDLFIENTLYPILTKDTKESYSRRFSQEKAYSDIDNTNLKILE